MAFPQHNLLKEIGHLRQGIFHVNNLNLTKFLQPLSHRRLVANLSIFYRCFHGNCSQEIRDIIPIPLRRVRNTRRSTNSHPCQVSLPTLSTNSIPQIIVRPKNVQFMERLVCFFLSQILQITLFQIQNQ